MHGGQLRIACNGVLLFVLMLGISGCAGGRTKDVPKPPRAAEAWIDVTGKELLVVGKIEVFPPIQPIEQKTLDELDRNKAGVVFDDELRGLLPRNWIFRESMVKVPLNEPFFVALSGKMKYFIGATIPMRREKSGRRGEVAVALPVGLRVASLPQDRAIYIGTVRYFRDEFFDILRVEIIDDYEQAKAQYVKKFGTAVVLRKSLLHSSQPKKEPVSDPVVPQQQTFWHQAVGQVLRG